VSKSNYLKNAILNAVLTGVLPEFLQDKSIFVALHTDDPLSSNASGKQDAYEMTFDGYSRTEMLKSSESFLVKDSTGRNNVDISFSHCKSGGQIAKYWSFGRSASGPGDILYSGKMSSELGIGAMSIPFSPKNDISITEG
jgi:hypothetical protein